MISVNFHFLKMFLNNYPLALNRIAGCPYNSISDPNGIGPGLKVHFICHCVVNFDKFLCTCTTIQKCTAFGVLKDVNISI